MSNAIPSKETDTICHCTETSRETIQALVKKNITQLDAISRMTGACSGCGSCEMAILELVAECNSTSPI